MSLQQYSEVYLDYALRGIGAGAGLTDSVVDGGSDLYELTKKGFACVNPFDTPWNVKTRSMADSSNAQVVSDQLPKPHTIMFVGGLYGDDPHDYAIARLAAFKQIIASMHRARDWAYLRIGLYDGASMNYYRKYGWPGGVTSPMKLKSVGHVPESLSFSFHVTDPLLYETTENVEAITVTAGTGNTGVFAVQYPTQRAIIKITKNGADNPTNPVITNAAGQTLYIYGSLSNVNDYWLVDLYEGRVWKSISGTVTDVSATTAGGQWLTLDGFETVTITDGGANDYVAAVTWLERAW